VYSIDTTSQMLGNQRQRSNFSGCLDHRMLALALP